MHIHLRNGVDNIARITKKCGFCGGSGKVDDEKCPVCGGDSYVVVEDPAEECPLCEGRGRYGGKRCSACGGAGWEDVVE